MESPLLSVHGLTRSGLEPVSFELDAGECLALRGPSGSGKSLLLRALADLDPNGGEVALQGTGRDSVAAPEWRRLVAYLAAEPGWWGETVGAHFTDWPAAEALVLELGLPRESRDWPILRLSTGERQRLALVRALVRKPRVLLLDEPTSGLDAAARDATEQMIKGHLAQGGGTIWATHDPEQAKRMARRALVIDGGRIAEAAL